MEYPKPVMKMGELVKMGFPRSFLDEAYRERGQDFAQKGAKKNSPIFFDTELFVKWRQVLESHRLYLCRSVQSQVWQKSKWSVKDGNKKSTQTCRSKVLNKKCITTV